MKTFLPSLFTCLLAVSVFADDAKTNSVATNLTAAASEKISAAALTLPMSAATVTAPMVMTNGVVSQVLQMDLPQSGKAVINFSITNAGNYLIKAIVNAPAEDSNSFYLNVDAQPEDPMMIWDIEVTSGFQETTVSWRGNGAPDSDEFSPKVFNLKAGAHKLIVVAREPSAELKSVSIVPQPPK